MVPPGGGTCDDAGVTSVPTSRSQLPLRRPPRGRALAGVCAGVAAHLGLPVKWVRIAWVLATVASGAGLVLYLWLWFFVPAEDPAEAAAAQRPVTQSRLAPRLQARLRTLPVTELVLGVVLLGAAVALLLGLVGVELLSPWLVPVLVILGGAALVWSQVDASTSASRGRRGSAMVRIVGGVALAMLGIFLMVSQGRRVDEFFSALVGGGAVVAGIGVILAPLWLRLVRDLGAERAARAREAERADIAAHLHDSVLQTLTLIRSRATDAEQVARLARAQERQLRDWLYTDRPDSGSSVAEAVRQIVAEVEDLHGVPIEVVTAGDRPPDSAIAALVAATREALVNAVVHGRPPVSVYVETTHEGTEVFIRDRGPGFDPQDVAPDRHGVRESIIARVERHGGTVRIRSRGPGASSGGAADEMSGTEVIMSMPAKEES